jgi:hypothetical protein
MRTSWFISRFIGGRPVNEEEDSDARIVLAAAVGARKDGSTTTITMRKTRTGATARALDLRVPLDAATQLDRERFGPIPKTR